MAGDGFLDELSPAARDELRQIAVRRSWPAGAVLFREGDRADRVLVIERGIVKALTVSEAGTETVLGLRGAGDILGELAAIDGGVRSASVVAVEPVEALVVPVDGFREFLRGVPEAALVLLALIAARLRGASARQAEFGSLDASVRLARLLVELAETYGEPVDGGVRLRLLSQDELASLCGASREAVARALRQFRDEGLVETGRRSVTCRDLVALGRWESG